MSESKNFPPNPIRITKILNGKRELVFVQITTYFPHVLKLILNRQRHRGCLNIDESDQ